MVKIYEIGKNFYTIRSSEKDFHRNIYIKRFVGEKQTINLIMDPGTKIDMENLSEALDKLIGGIDKIHLIFLSHQDPDVSSLTPFIMSSSKAFVMASQDTIRLVKMYGIPEKRILPIENFKSESVVIKETGHRIKFVPAYFCHFRGAMMMYDLESRILFSGDFLGGLNTVKGDSIWADSDAWLGISIFHSIYMPSNLAVRETISRIGLLTPLPEIIAPQHGYLVKGDYIPEFLAKLSQLNVGIDLMTSEEPLTENLLMAINGFLEKLKESKKEIHSLFIKRFSETTNFTTPLEMKGESVVNIKIPSSDIIKFIIDEMARELNSDDFNKVKSFFIMNLEKYNVPYKMEWVQRGKEEDTLAELFN